MKSKKIQKSENRDSLAAPHEVLSKQKANEVEGSPTSLMGQLFSLTPESKVSPELRKQFAEAFGEGFAVLGAIHGDIKKYALQIAPALEIKNGMTYLDLWEQAEKVSTDISEIFKQLFPSKEAEWEFHKQNGPLELRDALKIRFEVIATTITDLLDLSVVYDPNLKTIPAPPSELLEKVYVQRRKGGKCHPVKFIRPAIVYDYFKEHSPVIYKIVEDHRNPLESELDSLTKIVRFLESEVDRIGKEREQQEKDKNLSRLELTRYQPLAKTNNLRFSCTNINKLFIEALMPGAMKDFSIVQDSLEGLKNKTLMDALQYKTAYVGHSKSDLEGVVGFKHDLTPEIKDILENESHLLTKAHYILSERFYEQTGGENNGQAFMTLNQFCDDLGMSRKNGAHTPKNKERARLVFELHTSTRISALAYVNGKKEPARVSDNMWRQGAEIESQKRGRWFEHILTFTRGIFDDEWQKWNKKFVGYIHRGFLELKPDLQDKYAILLGGYLASFAKMNKYQIQSLTLLPILKKLGLWTIYAESNPGKMREKLERALDKLVDVGILREWRIEEMSNVQKAVKQMSKAVNYEEKYEEVDNDGTEPEPDKWVKIWLNKRLVIAYPTEFDERGKLNIEKRDQHIKRNQKTKLKTATKRAELLTAKGVAR